MVIDILTLFPEMFAPLFTSIPAKAQKKRQVVIRLHNLRDWADNRHRQVDDLSFGGGPGMVIQPQPLARAIESISSLGQEKPYVIYMSPQAQPLCQKAVKEFSEKSRLLIICGHYESIDERIIEKYVDEEVSIGDYVLSGGELAAMVLSDAVIRLLKGVIDEGSAAQESHSGHLLDYPHYSRPAVFEGASVPEVLLSGDHKKIEAWRQKQAVLATCRKRFDMIEKAGQQLSSAEKKIVKEYLEQKKVP